MKAKWHPATTAGIERFIEWLQLHLGTWGRPSPPPRTVLLRTILIA